MSELPSPDGVLDYWLGTAIEDAEAAKQKNQLWFIKSDATDAHIKTQFSPLLQALADGLAEDWAAIGPRARLAAIIVFDQFSRNMFRGQSGSFAYDPFALQLTEAGLSKSEDAALSEVERIFFYLPLEHSERLANQDRCVALYAQLAQDARSDFKPLCQSTLDYAHKHRDVIRQFGRFPHRNAILKRTNTAAEQAYLDQPGSGF